MTRGFSNRPLVATASRANDSIPTVSRRDRDDAVDDDDDDDDDARAWIADAVRRRDGVETKDKSTAFQQKQVDESRRVEGGVDVVRAIE